MKWNYARKCIHFIILVYLFFPIISFSQTYLTTESFDGTTYPPTGWSSGTGWSRVTTGTYPTSSPHSGVAMAKFNSCNLSSGTVGFLISNSFNLTTSSPTNRPVVNFWMYRDAGSAKNDRMEIYINTTGITTDDVYHLGTVYRYTENSPVVLAAGWYNYSFTIPSTYSGAANYLIIRGVSFYGNNMFIDDIQVLDPPPIEVISSTTQQVSDNTIKVGSSDNKIIRLNVVTDGLANPLNITNIKFSTAGSTNSSDISSAKVYYTTNTTFSNVTQFGTTTNLPNGEFDVTATMPLALGNNYFWLVYNIPESALGGNVVDALCLSFTTTQTDNPIVVPDPTNPAGNSTLIEGLRGTKTISNSGGDYSTLSEAVNALNNAGVGPGGVTFLITDGQTFDEPGLINITETGIESRPVIIRQSGTGLKPILKFTGTSATSDACIKLSGSDYFTIDGLEIRDDNTLSTFNTEYGIYLLAQTANGCNYNTVKNCIINLYANNKFTKGVYTYADYSSTLGKNSYNKFYNNVITECYIGYHLEGSSYSNDEYNEIGTIDGGISELKNMGGSESYPIYGIQCGYQKDISIYNTKMYNCIWAGTYLMGVYIKYAPTSGTTKIFNNEFSNFNSTSTSDGIIYVISNSDDGTSAIEIYNNIIHGFTFDYENFYGMEINSGTTKIYNNKIYDVTYSGSSTKIIKGIGINKRGVHNVYNNFIYDLNSPNSAPYSTTYASVNGFYIGSSSYSGFNTYLEHNTVYLNYTSTNASNRSTAIYVSSPNSYTSTVVLRNNIFVNNTDISTAGALAAAFWYGGSIYTNFSTLSNNNLYYAGTPGTKNLIFYDNTNSEPTIRGYRTRMATRDQISYTELPPFVRLTNSLDAEIDVHIKTNTATQVEGGGQQITLPITITKDIDNENRTVTSPDLGADEGTFLFGNDGIDPVISYTLLEDAVVAETRTVTGISISDKSGVNISEGIKPKMYYKKSTDENTFNDNTNSTAGWKYVEASNLTSPFEFVIDYSKLNSYPLAVGNNIQYFVVAEDSADTPNVGINSGTFAVIPLTVILTSTNFPISGTINSYNLREGVSGEFLVGAGQVYTTLTGTDGLFAKINASTVTGNITAKITSDIAETGAIALNSFSSSYGFAIKPNDASVKIISGNYSGGLIRFNGADKITIDGRYEGIGNYLSFYNSAQSNAIACLQFISSGVGQGSQNNTIRNCNIYTNTFYYNAFAIFVGGASPATTSTGADNDNYTIVNNKIYKTKFGICVTGNSTDKPKNILIENNSIGYKEAKNYYIGQYGIYLEQTDSSAINNNEIFNVINYNYSLGKLRGIFLGEGVANLNINKNKLYNIIFQNSSDNYGAGGIEVNTKNASSNIVITNNSIGRINGYRASSTNFEYSIFGIGIFNNSGGVKIYNNSICMAGTNNNITAISTGLYISAAASNIEIINNTITNTTTFSTSTTSKSYAVYSSAGTGAFTAINYNNYYINGAQGVLGYFSGEKSTIENWRAATGQDVNSLSVDPLYLNDNNLKPLNTSPLFSAGIPISGIITDIEGTARHLTLPAIGAYETGTGVPEIDWCNLESGNLSTVEGITTNYYSKIFEEGLTENMDQGPNIQCWIGYNTLNTDPSTWPDSIWLPAVYNANGTETNGRDDYYKGMGLKGNGGNLPGGTYYIASRYKIKHSGYKYGGYSLTGGGIWDGVSKVSSVLTITDPVITWANYDNINETTLGQAAEGTFYARVVVDGITTLNTSSTSRIKAWIGFSETNTDPSTWTDPSVWTAATISGYRTSFDATQDQYKITYRADLDLRTYYAAAKFQLDNDPIVYGGFSSSGGGIWDGTTNKNGTVTIIESTISWANLETNAVTLANNDYLELYGGVKIDGVTSIDDTCDYIKAWVGFSPENTNPNTWLIWREVSFWDAYDDSHIYIYDGNEPVGVGTFYYAFRFKFNDNDYVYGGYSSDGGGIWDGTNNVSGVMNVTGSIITSFPYSQGFESVTFPPTGWRQYSDEMDIQYWEVTNFSFNGNQAAGVCYNHNPNYPAILQTPKLTLEPNMRMRFWWLDQDPDYYSTAMEKTFSGGNNIITPLIVGHDTTYLEISTNHGGTWTTVAILSDDEPKLNYKKEIVNLAAYANKTVVFRWRDQTDATMLSYGALIDDIFIEKIPDQNGSTIIPDSTTNQISFGNTGVTLKFSTLNSDSLLINVDRYAISPGGTLPAGLTTLASRYWAITIEGGTLDDPASYTLTLDLTGVGGISNYSTIHLLKRNNSTQTWADLGVPNDISAAPILKWTGLTSFSEFGIGSTGENAFPVELKSFVATTNADCVNLDWSTATEINVNGFTIERTINKTEKEWQNAGYIQAAGNSNTVNEYNFVDKMVTGGTRFIYRLKIVDNDGSFNYSQQVNVEIIPVTFEVFQNYPNPFNPETTIKFSLPSATKVNLVLYNSIGQLVAELINTEYEAGYYNYILNANAIKGGLASGVYYYRIITPEFNMVKKLMLIK